MNRVFTIAAVGVLGMALQLPQALACEAGSAAVPQPTAGAAGAPHYEWQQHYVGHHARIEGHWVLVN